MQPPRVTFRPKAARGGATDPEVVGAVVGAVSGVSTGIIGGAWSYLKSLKNLNAAREESYGKYKQGVRAAYREFLTATQGLDHGANGKLPDDRAETLRDMYYKAYFAGSPKVEAALEAFWPKEAREQGTRPTEEKRGALESAMAEHVRP